MRQRKMKSRCEKRHLSKCEEVCRTYDKVQYSYATRLEEDPNIESFKCNVYLEGLEIGDFTSDFVAVKANGDLMVRECVWRKNLPRPRTLKLLDASRDFWVRRGVQDWGIVIDAEEK